MMDISSIKSLLKQDLDDIYNKGQLETLDKFESLKGNLSGVAVAANDVNNVGHSVGCKVASKNLLNFSIEHLFDSGINKSYYENGTLYVETGSGNSLGILSNKIYLPTNIPLCYKHKIADTNGDRVVIRCYDENNNNISDNISIGWGSYLAYYEGHFGTGAKGFSFILPQQVSYVVLAYCRMKSNTDLVFNEYSELQIELGTTATEYTPYISNFEGIEVSRYGKNLCPVTKHATNPTLYRRCEFSYLLAGYYTIFSPDTILHFIGFNGCRASRYIKDANGNTCGVIILLDQSGSGFVAFRRGDETTWLDDTKVMFLQGIVEYEEAMLEEYEPYKGQTYVANIDGVVEDVKSISPNMTLFSNNNAVSINAKYYKDPDIVISNLQQAIALTGGE